MSQFDSQTTGLQAWLDELRSGNESARAELIGRSCERLRQLTHRMLKNYPRLRRWEQTDDVLQNAMLRLHRSLAEVKPASAEQFIGFAAVQVRRTLLDLVRHHFGPEGAAGHHHTDAHVGPDIVVANRCESLAAEPEDLDGWTRFHQAAESLPDAERQVFNLLWYEGLSQAEAAAVIDVAERTVRRRWLAARYAISEALGGQAPR